MLEHADNRQLDPEQARKLRAIETDFRYFSKNCIKIKGKKPGSVLPLIFNDAQDILDYAVSKMLADLGWVRIIIVKGRQQGVSTYIEMRLFWKALTIPNTQVCIISHDAESATSLFRKAVFAREQLPPNLQFEPLASNRKELIFPNGSSYLVVTAGSEHAGRSQTAHHQHQSERGFYEKAEDIDAGVGQIVSDEPGTEIYKESTGNGMNHFYQEVLNSLAGKGKFRVVFIPWFLQREYRTPPEADFKRTKEEGQLVDLYNLDDHQLQWRRDKIVELKTLRKFRQEYPNTLMEAFQAPGNTFYDPDLIAAARKSTLQADFGPIIIGVDPGREGDRTVIVVRRGRQVLEIIKYDTMQQMRLAGIVSALIDKWNADKCFIDWGMGHGTIDRLHERKYRAIVEGVHFGGSADDELYLNKRAEMAFRFKEWLEAGEVNLPDDDDMQADIAAMPDFELTSSSRIKFKSKDEIKESYGRSPDILDAIMLTFAFNVHVRNQEEDTPKHTVNTRKGSQMSTLVYIRGTTRNQDDLVVAPTTPRKLGRRLD